MLTMKRSSAPKIPFIVSAANMLVGLDVGGRARPWRGRWCPRCRGSHRVSQGSIGARRRRQGSAPRSRSASASITSSPGDGRAGRRRRGRRSAERAERLALAEPLDQAPVGDREPGAGVLDHMGEDVAPIGGVDRDVDRAEIVDREPATRTTVGPVRQPHDDRVVLLDPQRLQPRGGRPGQLEQLPARPFGAVLEHRKHVVRSLRGAPLEHLPQHAFLTTRSPREHESLSPSADYRTVSTLPRRFDSVKGSRKATLRPRSTRLSRASHNTPGYGPKTSLYLRFSAHRHFGRTEG